MPDIRPAIELTGDGSETLRHPVLGETYHSVRGALGEAAHVFIRNGLAAVGKPHISVFEAGFGSGLNAWLTMRYARGNGIGIDYHTVELYPVSGETVAALGYSRHGDFTALHAAPWGEKTQVAPGFAITKARGDLAETEFSTIFDIVYYDAFAPDRQPELWTGGIFSL